jgi:hypothetical protein
LLLVGPPIQLHESMCLVVVVVNTDIKTLLQDALGEMCDTLAAVDDTRPKRPMDAYNYNL